MITAGTNLSTWAIVVSRCRIDKARLPVHPVPGPVFTVNFAPETGPALSTQEARAHGMTNAATTANVAAQQIIFEVIKSIQELDKQCSTTGDRAELCAACTLHHFSFV